MALVLHSSLLLFTHLKLAFVNIKISRDHGGDLSLKSVSTPSDWNSAPIRRLNECVRSPELNNDVMTVNCVLKMGFQEAQFSTLEKFPYWVRALHAKSNLGDRDTVDVDVERCSGSRSFAFRNGETFIPIRSRIRFDSLTQLFRIISYSRFQCCSGITLRCSHVVKWMRSA